MWIETDGVQTNLLGKFFSNGRKLHRRMKVGFNGDKYMHLAEAIESDVNRISTLIGGARTLEPIRADRESKATAKYWLQVGECARRLFLSLSSRWPKTCVCNVTHVASLPLDIVDISHIQLYKGFEPRLEILFSFEFDGTSISQSPWPWKFIEIEPKLACMP